MGHNKTIMRSLLVIFLLVTSMSAEGKTLLGERDIRSLIDGDWTVIQAQHKFDSGDPDSISWDYRITPGFPAIWPPQESVVLVYYGYPCGFSTNLHDGVHIGRPWVRVEVAPGRAPQKKDLLRKISKMGVQGVRPLDSKEIQIAENGLIVQDYLRKLTGLPADQKRRTAMLRDYYCFWLRTNSLIGGSIHKQHANFISWLQCK